MADRDTKEKQFVLHLFAQVSRSARLLAFGVFLCCWVSLVGCQSLFHFPSMDLGKAQSTILRKATSSPDSVAMEIFIARIPKANEQYKELWQSVDELSLPDETRRALAKNGFRAGIVSGVIPDSMARIFHLKDPIEQQAEATKEQGSLAKSKQCDAAFCEEAGEETAVTKTWKRLQKGQRTEINISDVYETLPLFTKDETGLHGKTYEQAQGVFVVRVTPKPMQRVELELTPELQHGRSKQRFTGEGALWKIEVTRDKEVFEAMRIVTDLQPGQMLIIGPSGVPGSIGHYFHDIAPDKGGGRKMMIIRMAEVPENDEPALP